MSKSANAKSGATRELLCSRCYKRESCVQCCGTRYCLRVRVHTLREAESTVFWSRLSSLHHCTLLYEHVPVAELLDLCARLYVDYALIYWGAIFCLALPSKRSGFQKYRYKKSGWISDLQQERAHAQQEASSQWHIALVIFLPETMLAPRLVMLRFPATY